MGVEKMGNHYEVGDDLYSDFDPHNSYIDGVLVFDEYVNGLYHKVNGNYKIPFKGGIADCHPMGDPRTNWSTNRAQETGGSKVWGIRWWDKMPTEY